MSSSLRIAAVIPARYASTRLPGKPLIKIGGVTMVERVYRQAKKARHVNEVIVATEDQRIAEAVSAFGGQSIMTSPDHFSGTDRLAEVAALRPDFDIIVNVQGDQPMIDPNAIDAAIAPMLSDPSIEMSTIAAPLEDKQGAENPDTVKVVLDNAGFALYFSRSPIPYYRDQSGKSVYLAHVGLYVYKRDCLAKVAAMEPSPLEIAESLEQLRALAAGIKIKVVTTSYFAPEVNVPSDVGLIETLLSSVL